MFCTLISNSAYAMIAPFLPIEYEEKGVSGEWVGMIFAEYSVAVIIFSPMVGMVIQRFGTVNLISGGILFMGCAFICFGLVVQSTSVEKIISLSLLIRFVQGASSAFVQTTCYSIAANDYPESKEAIVGWLEAVTGIGCIMGPVVGSILYSAMGFTRTFMAYGIFLIALSFVIKLNMK